MSENQNKIIDELSLEFFLNKDLYGKYLEKKNPEKIEQYKKDKRFYRKRICDLTKQMFNNEAPINIKLNKDIQIAFDMYTKVCIEYFKVLDKNDILQEDYSGLLEGSSEINKINVEDIHSLEDANNLLMRSIKIVEPNSLEKLVKRTSTKAIKKEVLPIEKEINLKDPVLKKKGIKKKDKKEKTVGLEKNNINNIYDKKENKI